MKKSKIYEITTKNGTETDIYGEVYPNDCCEPASSAKYIDINAE